MPASNRAPVSWIPTLYFAEGLPNVIVTGVAGVALLRFGLSNVEATAYTSALNLPWVIKPLWAPVVERLALRRSWILAMQAVGALLLALLAPILPEKSWLPLTLGLLAGIGLASASHDIAADGFYMDALDEHRQAEWSGVRNTFFRVAMIAGSGGLVWLAGWCEKDWGLTRAWTAVFALAAGVMGFLAIYHYFTLPRPALDAKLTRRRRQTWGEWAGEFARVWETFVQKPDFGRMLAFILLYRFAEGQVLKGNIAFFLASPNAGGLGLATEEIGLLYGTIGVVALLAGGIAGGLAIARTGLRRQLWPMAMAMNMPNILYVWMAWAQPHHRGLIGGILAFEQFGYGYGFAAYMVYLLYVARGAHATAHYAICSGLMALGMMLAGLVAAEALQHTAALPGGGYGEFFIWAMACTLVSFAVLWKLPLKGDFGRGKHPVES